MQNIRKIFGIIYFHIFVKFKLKSNSEGHSLLASEYQLKLLSTQRSQAAKAGSKKRIFITAPRSVLFYFRPISDFDS